MNDYERSVFLNEIEFIFEPKLINEKKYKERASRVKELNPSLLNVTYRHETEGYRKISGLINTKNYSIYEVALLAGSLNGGCYDEGGVCKIIEQDGIVYFKMLEGGSDE